MTEPHTATAPKVEAKDIELQEQTATSSDNDRTFTQETAPTPGAKNFLQKTIDVATWVPRKLRYDPENPPAFGLGLNILYAIVSAVPSFEIWNPLS